MNPLIQPIHSLNGVGTQSISRLQKLGLFCLQDLLFHLPLRYEDKTHVSAMGSLKIGSHALVCGRIDYAEIVPKGRKCLMCHVVDNSGAVSLRFYHYSVNQFQAMKQGLWLCAFGEVRQGYAGLEMTHPEYRIIPHPDAAVTDSKLTPIYPSTEGLSQTLLRKAIHQALSLCEATLIDYLPDSLLKRLQFPPLLKALKLLHAPDEALNLQALQNGSAQALQRLAFEELLAHHLSLRMARQQVQVWQAPIFKAVGVMTEHFLNALPFKLTNAQQRVIAEIEADCQLAKPMLRLLQGDVGSGKTVVAAYSALLALSAGYQVAVMSPTELLAEQHYRNFCQWFSGFDTQLVYLTGSIKGKARKSALQAMSDGKAGIIIGTHALFQDEVQFFKLGLIIIDEQHRFGVHQRLALREKGQNAGLRPHQLVMTATPIPRTLAMLNYADLDVSVIDELPPNRQSIATSVLPAERRDEIIVKIAAWIAQGKQVYWVCTLIDESERLQAQAAQATAEQLMLALPQVRLGLVHGRMKGSEKEAVMLAFKAGELDLLVATTVIEVGVDVPNANLMVIENPERLGLSQLHQLRGRVGRGECASYCLLLYQSPLSALAKQRLGILRDSTDGFLIAEKDLALRGAGELLGTKQTGQTRFKIADLSRDAPLLPLIASISDDFLVQHPQAVEGLCERWLSHSSDYAEV